MDNMLSVVTIGGLVLIVLILLVVFLHTRAVYQMQIGELQLEIQRLKDNYDNEAKKSLSTQRAVIKGQLAEQLYPLSEQCPYMLSDMKFMGMPIDYIIFDGYTECKDGNGDIKEIIFADIKSGKAKLSPHQRAIRDAVNAGRVRWETINV